MMTSPDRSASKATVDTRRKPEGQKNLSAALLKQRWSNVIVFNRCSTNDECQVVDGPRRSTYVAWKSTPVVNIDCDGEPVVRVSRSREKNGMITERLIQEMDHRHPRVAAIRSVHIQPAPCHISNRHHKALIIVFSTRTNKNRLSGTRLQRSSRDLMTP